ncbi:Scr1 family TA system antitoxin-like transcriptional regulator [Streptomyces sp. NPDC088725]|uniref:Scr1 family TA system antitoxin-like transcriptional regulator n=1 Tax=Streptomyces sp. NPDC088725 TaxID=3365873 RepID=UPI00380B4896
MHPLIPCLLAGFTALTVLITWRFTPTEYEKGTPVETQPSVAAEVKRATPGALVVGAYARRVRAVQGLTLGEVARVVRRDKTTLSEFERGLARLRGTEVAELLVAMGVDGEEAEVFWRLTESPGYRELNVLFDREPGWAQRVAACERQAKSRFSYSTWAIPHALQTPRYAEALHYPWWRRSSEHAARALPTYHGQVVTVLVAEPVLRQPVGGREVMAEQLNFLQREVRRRSIRLLVVPRTAGLVARRGVLTQLHLHGQTLWVEEAEGVFYATGPKAGQARRTLMTAAMSAAVSEKRSAYMLAQACNHFERRAGNSR